MGKLVCSILALNDKEVPKLICELFTAVVNEQISTRLVQFEEIAYGQSFALRFLFGNRSKVGLSGKAVNRLCIYKGP